MRAADADREHVAERLRTAAVEGRLLTEELEERLEAVFSARTYGELEALTQDLPRAPAPSSRNRRSSAPIPWPAAVLVVMFVMPVVVAVVVAAVVLVASMFLMWGLVAAVAMWIFGHRLRSFGPHVHGRARHACAGRWRA